MRLAGRLALVLIVALGGCAAPKRVGESGRLGPHMATGTVPFWLRVGLVESRTEQFVAATGAWTVSCADGVGPVLALAADDTLAVRADAGRVRYAGRVGTGTCIRLVAEPAMADHFLLWDGRPWRGALQVIASPLDGSLLTMINLVELESYLIGVLPLEIGRGRQPAELPALAAQAVAARTYAAGRIGGRQARGFDLFADVRDQVYGGVAVEDPLTSRAVAATAGQVLWRGQQLADAFFHSTCGGHTAANDAVWPVAADPLLRGVDDRRRGGTAWCADSRYATWQAEWSWQELEAVLAVTLPRYIEYAAAPARAAWAADAFRPATVGRDSRHPGELRNLNVLERTAEGRVKLLEITTAAGRYRVRGDQTRRVLATDARALPLLRSAWFELEITPEVRVIARGRGWGHGLGLCQMGALARARSGQSAAEILRHYYPGSRLGPLRADAPALP